MAATKRVNITIHPETLRLADRTARRRMVSRSELIRAAIHEAAEAQDRQAEAEAPQRRQQEAVNNLDRLAHQFGDWPAEQILRAARDRWRKNPPAYVIDTSVVLKWSVERGEADVIQARALRESFVQRKCRLNAPNLLRTR
jgi:Arc/MetJ-type ribon-helix-helix transcriptional regulator